MPEAVGVDQVADVGPGELHRLPDRRDGRHPARPEQAGAVERGLAPTSGEDHDVVPTVGQAGDDLAGDVGRGCRAGPELLGHECDAHASTVPCTGCPERWPAREEQVNGDAGPGTERRSGISQSLAAPHRRYLSFAHGHRCAPGSRRRPGARRQRVGEGGRGGAAQGATPGRRRPGRRRLGQAHPQDHRRHRDHAARHPRPRGGPARSRPARRPAGTAGTCARCSPTPMRGPRTPLR